MARLIEADVLMRSRRRCCLCAFLNGDFREKRGQIAHVDKNSENDIPENLVFLCFDHHDRYDSSTRQSKNFTSSEIVRYRTKLWNWSEKVDHVESLNPDSAVRLDIPWAFELNYPSVKLLFRISPTIYDVLPQHDPDIASLDTAIENPVHAAKGCFHVLPSYYVGDPGENIAKEAYLKLSVVQSCKECNNPPVKELRKFISYRSGDYEASILMWSLKSVVFKDIRRLITLETPLVGRITLMEWKHWRGSLRFYMYRVY